MPSAAENESLWEIIRRMQGPQGTTGAAPRPGGNPFGDNPAEIARGPQQAGGPATVPQKYPQGMANFYDDSWKQILSSMEGQGGIEEALQGVLRNFKGKPGDLENFMRQAQPFLGAIEAGKLRKGKSMKFLEDEGNWDLGAMAGYGTGAGMIGQAGARGMAQGQNQLAAMGLGRGSARAALAQQGMQQQAGQQADLWSRTYQQAQQNKQQSALQLMDAHRAIAQMALGQQITPRQTDGSSSNWAGIMGAAGQLGSGVGAIAALSDRRAKQDIVPLGQLENGLTFYRFRYLGQDAIQVGLMADEVQRLHPEAVFEKDGLLHVDYLQAVL